MILPGISGSLVLLLLGKYTFMLDALKHFKLQVLITFVVGGVTGLLSFTRLISWFLHRFPNYTIAWLAGCMLGSLYRIWPWQQVIQGGGVSISPVAFRTVFHQDPLVGQACLWAGAGVLLAVVMERLAAYFEKEVE